MFAHTLLTLYRSIARHRLYAAINVLGLALGIAVFVVLMLVVRLETSFERWIPDSGQIYAIRTNVLNQGWQPYTMGGLLEELRGDYPQLVGTRADVRPGSVRQGGTITAEQLTEVDPTFFKVFDLPLVAGDRSKLLRSPDEMVISEATARKYFGGANPIGQHMTVNLDDEVRVYRVSGEIKDPPRTTDLTLDLLVPILLPTPEKNRAWRHWGNMGASTYLRLATPSDARALNGQLDAFTDRHSGPVVHSPPHLDVALRLAPLTAMHLLPPPGVAVVTAIAAVAALTLLLAAMNYVNLATARAALRAKEVALRKVMGATAPGLVGQFIGESVATAVLAVLVGLALCELALPLFSAAMGAPLRLDYFGDAWMGGTIAAVIVVVGLGAGLYPAWVLSRFQPAAVLASARSPGGGRSGARLREALVIFQFATAIAFTIGTAVIVRQSAYIHRADLGFQREGLIEVDSFPHPGLSAAQRASLLEAWRAEPRIVNLTQADTDPGDPDIPVAPFRQPNGAGEGKVVHYASIGPDFFQTYGARLLAGRLPDRSRAADFAAPVPDKASVSNVVLNVRALEPLGFRSAQEAIGKPLIGKNRSLQVIGVIADLRFESPRKRVEPIVYWSFSGTIEGGAAVVRYAGADPRALIRRMAADWQRIVPTEPFEAKTVVDELTPYYRADDQVSRMLTIAAALAVLIGCIGLYGLVSFSTARRIKEIGIRKTLGASSLDVLGLLIGQFLRPVLLANLAAWPLAYLAMRAYLAGFDQRIAMTPADFLAASALAVAVALGTVVAQALSAARSEPAKALRHE